jgi:endonuclease G
MKILLLILTLFNVAAVAAEVLRLDYSGGFTVWLDCEKRGAVKFQYNAQRDSGNAQRSSSFYMDSKVPTRCQQTSTASYKRESGAKPTYDRGHLVPANHLDHSADAIRQTNTITNILPQVASMNRGAWKHTEEIVECYWDIDELLVIGGVLWGTDASNDYFVSSHGITTPDAFWKVVVRPGRVMAWIIPNSEAAKYKVLDNYLVSVRKIEKLTGEKIPVEEFLKDEVPNSSWQIPIGCDKG